MRQLRTVVNIFPLTDQLNGMQKLLLARDLIHAVVKDSEGPQTDPLERAELQFIISSLDDYYDAHLEQWLTNKQIEDLNGNQ